MLSLSPSQVSAIRRLLTTTSITTTSHSSPVIELRQYQLICGDSGKYIASTESSAMLRKSLLPLRLFCASETGTALNTMTHLYYYKGGMEERDNTRVVVAKNADWRSYLQICRPCVLEQKSWIYVEAGLVNKFGLCGLKTEVIHPSENSSNSIYEIRRYKLKLGYDTVPKFLSLYEEGLASKLNAEGTDPTTQLCSVLYSEVGDLNHVIEIWRHGDGVKAMHASRLAARSASPWRNAIAGIAELATEFTSSIHKPLPLSNWK
jgi:hypothetical protein